jgi:hypothetical protein
MKNLLMLLFLTVVGVSHAAPLTPFPTQQVAQGVFLIGQLDTNEINESSGLIVSRRTKGAYWTHNDGDNALFAFTRGGRRLGTWKMGGPVLEDFEDIAWTPGRIYLGDIGNNLLLRTNIHVYSVPEPGATFSGSLPVKGHWRLTYPNNEPFDAESLFIHGRYGYILSKELVDNSVGFYRFPLRKRRSELEPMFRLQINSPVAGVDITRDLSRVAFITSRGAYLMFLPGFIPQLGLAGPDLFVNFRFDGMEACCFTPNGLLVTAETGEIFLFTHDLFKVARP